MATSVSAPGLYDLRSWQNASASVSLVSAADTQTALEQLLETLTRTVSTAVAMAETDSAMRTVGVIEHAAQAIAGTMALMPSSLLHAALKSRTEAEQLAYQVSTTRIARTDQTGVLVRVRETTGDLTLPEETMRTLRAFIARQIEGSIAAVLKDWPQMADQTADLPNDFRVVDDGACIDVTRTTDSAERLQALRDANRGLPMFLRARLRLQHNEAQCAEATVMLLFSSDG